MIEHVFVYSTESTSYLGKFAYSWPITSTGIARGSGWGQRGGGGLLNKSVGRWRAVSTLSNIPFPFQWAASLHFWTNTTLPDIEPVCNRQCMLHTALSLYQKYKQKSNAESEGAEIVGVILVTDIQTCTYLNNKTLGNSSLYDTS